MESHIAPRFIFPSTSDLKNTLRRIVKFLCVNSRSTRVWEHSGRMGLQIGKHPQFPNRFNVTWTVCWFHERIREDQIFAAHIAPSHSQVRLLAKLIYVLTVSKILVTRGRNAWKTSGGIFSPVYTQTQFESRMSTCRRQKPHPWLHSLPHDCCLVLNSMNTGHSFIFPQI